MKTSPRFLLWLVRPLFCSLCLFTFKKDKNLNVTEESVLFSELDLSWTSYIKSVVQRFYASHPTHPSESLSAHPDGTQPRPAT